MASATAIWRSHTEVAGVLAELPELERLSRAYCLSRFLAAAITAEGYAVPEALGEAIVLSREGESALAASGVAQGADARAALLAIFFHHDVLIDWCKTSLDELLHSLNAEFRSARLSLAHRFGRELYDRFNDDPRWERTNSLSPAETSELLHGAPAGVYQMGHYLSGPLGVLESPAARFLPPGRKIPLWHCADIGCARLHSVQLEPHPGPFQRAIASIRGFLRVREGAPSEWSNPLSWLHLGLSPPSIVRYADIAALIGDGIVGSDRATLLEGLLRSDHAPVLRKALRNHQPPITGSPAEIVKQLASEERLQLLLLVSDDALASFLDRSILCGELAIPIHEVRRAQGRPARRSYADPSTELSTLGVRSTEENPILFLTATIWAAYQGAGVTNDLQWRLETSSDQPLKSSLADFVRTRGPAAAVDKLILSSQPVAAAVAAALGVEQDQLRPTSRTVVDRLLWKFGFDPPRYEDDLPRLSARLERFTEAATAFDPDRGEDAREIVRSEGVNVFVFVEQLLDSLIAYNVWLLSSDHLGGTRFIYRLSEARTVVTSVLGSFIADAEVTVRWHEGGENALGVLLRYLAASLEWMQSLDGRLRDSLKRPAVDLPYYHDKGSDEFCFWHTALWADADRAELNKYIEGYQRIVRCFQQADLAAVRNGLDHYRNAARFPSADQMLACASRLRSAVDLIDAGRYVPKAYWLQKTESTRFGSQTKHLVDYRDRLLVLHGPALAAGLAVPTFSSPVIVAPGNLLGMPNSHLVMQTASESAFAAYWLGYPRRMGVAGPDERPSVVTAAASGPERAPDA